MFRRRPRPAKPRRRRRVSRWLARRLILPAATLVASFAMAVLLVLVFRVVNPPTTYLIATEAQRLGGVARQWRELDLMPRHVALAFVGAEDAGFCAHSGFEWEAIEAALREREDGGRLRGGSTITQQVAKNVFLWPARSWTRKGLEAVFTVLIEGLWPKRRIVEVYLNVAETGEGLFGVEAAAQAYFGGPAARLTATEAALIAAALPNPKARNPKRPTGGMRRRAAGIRASAETLAATDQGACLL